MDKKFRKSVSEIFLPEILDGDGDIVPIIADGDDGDLEDVEVPETHTDTLSQKYCSVSRRGSSYFYRDGRNQFNS